MITSELIERCNNSNEDLFFEFMHDLNKMSYIFESDKLTYSDIEGIRKIVRSYILAFLMTFNGVATASHTTAVSKRLFL